MAIYYLMQILNGQPISKSDAIESERPPEIVPPFNAVWTEAHWLAFLASQVPPVVTLADLMNDEEATPYNDFRAQVLAFCLEMGGGNEEAGFDAATHEEKVFFALNVIGTRAQRASVLTDENKEILEWRLSKGVL
jgi:hypothetical protein